MNRNVLVAIAWPYANGELHVGHMAGAILPGDIFARYHRLVGNRVLMVSGSDSHGTPITVRAEQEGVTPREVFQRYHRSDLLSQRDLGISYDLYTHTDTVNHHRVAQDVFRRLLENGYLYVETQRQFYSEALERFLPDRYVEGICPHCGYGEARGDQCDNCGRLLDALELGEPRSKLDDSTPVVRETEHFFLDLPRLEEKVLAWLDEGKEHWRANVLAFSRNYVKGGLQGRPITRDIAWGIPVPLEEYPTKRLYVWFEAVIGYLSASIEWAALREDAGAWKAWWYDPEALTYYFIGKDNIPFHTIIWPAELLGMRRLYEEEATFNLPHDVPANEFMNVQGTQASKSRNWAIWIPDLLTRYDPDAIRFYLTSVMPETSDTNFSWEDFVQRNNSELVGIWGNLVNRVLSFTAKHFGEVPEPGTLDEVDRALLEKAEAAFERVGEHFAAARFRAALAEGLEVAREANRYLEVKAPWSQLKEDRAAAATTLHTVLQAINAVKILLAPVLPFSAQALHEMLGYEGTLFGSLDIEEVGEPADLHGVLRYDGDPASGEWTFARLPVGRPLEKPRPLFKKLDPEVVEEELARMGV